jgi:hypothetical protein
MPRWDWGPAGQPAPALQEPSKNSGEPAVLPGSGEPVSFAAHIKPLFRPHDRQSMSFAFDLWSHADVAIHADEILRRLQDGSMPCDGGWDPEKVEVFKRWVETGTQP